jgi:hypothetical protein
LRLRLRLRDVKGHLRVFPFRWRYLVACFHPEGWPCRVQSSFLPPFSSGPALAFDGEINVLKRIYFKACPRLPFIEPIILETNVIHKICACSVAFSGFLAASAFALTIDDFSAGPLDVTITESIPYYIGAQEDLPEEAVIGRVRTHKTALEGPFDSGTGARIYIDTIAETYRFSTSVNMEANGMSYGFGYGPDDPLNLDLSEYNSFRLDVISLSLTGIVSITMTSGVNEDRLSHDFHRTTIPATNTPYSLVIPFSAFLAGIDFSDIDAIRLGSGGPAGFDLTLGGIYVVPEPTSSVLSLFAFGFTVCTMRRRAA